MRDRREGKFHYERRALAQIKSRCKTKRHYIQRGITVAAEFYGPAGFANFLAEVGPKPSPDHSVDRIHTGLGYVPGNMRWATSREQSLNKTTTRRLTHDGVTKPLVEWAAECNLTVTGLRARLDDQGWSVERALTTPMARGRVRPSLVREFKKEYSGLRSAMDRCHNTRNPDYATYGGAGVVVAETWRERRAGFQRFLDHIGPIPPTIRRPSLDRIDNNKGYEPGNVRWVDRSDQSSNRRSNIRITIDGRTQNLIEWTREFGIDYETIRARITAGASAEEALRRGGPGRQVTANGETKNLAAWSRSSGLPYDTLRVRLRLGWPPDEAVSAPVGARWARSRPGRRKAAKDA